MKKVALSEFRKLSIEQIQDMGSVEITYNCESLGIFVVGSIGAMKQRVEGIVSQIEIARPKVKVG